VVARRLGVQERRVKPAEPLHTPTLSGVRGPREGPDQPTAKLARVPFGSSDLTTR